MKIIFSKECLEYRSPCHPESPERVESSYLYLKEKGFEFSKVEKCCQEDILRVHTQELLEEVRQEKFFDPDTPALPGIFEYAKLSAGAAIESVKLALKGEFAFSLMRPPGHHARKDKLGGFCYFNNIAIATSWALKERIGKVAIIDFDCHHGNGTQDIFLGREDVLYLSLHQSPLYPGTGLGSVKNCLNFPLSAGTGPKDYLKVFEQALVKVREFNPDLLAVSAGFDAYTEDPLTQINLEKETYREIGCMIASLNKPSFAILEGGYSRDLKKCIYQFLLGIDSKQR